MHRHSHSHAHSHSHDDAPEDGPEFYVPEEDNALGAAIFFAYIAAALIFTSLIVHDLRRLRRVSASSKASVKISDYGVRSIRQTFIVFMCLVSFSTLSYHMLQVLIESYNSWTITHGSVDQSILYQGIFPFNLLDYLSAYRRSILHWSTTSTLFTSFAISILATPFRRIWTRLVLYYTLAFTIHLSDTAHTHSLPNLPWYFILSQILPISFTQHLSLLALSYRPVTPATTATSAPSLTHPTTLTYLLLTLLTTFLLETTLTPILPTSPHITSAILLIRLLLFLPLLIPHLTRRLFPAHHQTRPTTPIARILAAGLLGWQIRTIMALQGMEGGWAKLWAALGEDPAVAALGYDLVLAVGGAVGNGLLAALEGERVVAELEGEKGAESDSAMAQGEELLQRVQRKLKAGGVESSGVELGGNVDGELQERLDRALRSRGGT